MNRENKDQSRNFRKRSPFPPEGMELMEYLDLKEKAKSYIEIVMHLHSSLAFHEEDPEKKEKYSNERKINSDLLKSMTWMEVEVARPIVAEYPDLIHRLREKVKEARGDE